MQLFASKRQVNNNLILLKMAAAVLVKSSRHVSETVNKIFGVLDR